MKKESEFRYHYCRNSTKNMREKKRKGGERKCWILVMWIPKFLCPIPTTRVWSVRGVPKVKKKNLWQTNCINVIVEIGKKIFVTIVAMALPKMRKKKWFRNLGRSKKKCYVHNIFTINYMWLVIISSNLNLTLRLLF